MTRWLEKHPVKTIYLLSMATLAILVRFWQ